MTNCNKLHWKLLGPWHPKSQFQVCGRPELKMMQETCSPCIHFGSTQVQRVQLRLPLTQSAVATVCVKRPENKTHPRIEPLCVLFLLWHLSDLASSWWASGNQSAASFVSAFCHWNCVKMKCKHDMPSCLAQDMEARQDASDLSFSSETSWWAPCRYCNVMELNSLNGLNAECIPLHLPLTMLLVTIHS